MNRKKLEKKHFSLIYYTSDNIILNCYFAVKYLKTENWKWDYQMDVLIFLEKIQNYILNLLNKNIITLKVSMLVHIPVNVST